MRTRTKILLTGYSFGTPFALIGLCFVFYSGRILPIDATNAPMLRYLFLGLALLLTGVWVILYFVMHAYAGQAIEVKDLPNRTYRLVDKVGNLVVLEEGQFEWSPFGKRRYLVFCEGEVNHRNLYVPTKNNTLRRANSNDFARLGG